MKNLPAVQETWFQSLGLLFSGVSLVAQMVKNLLAMWETQVQALRQEDPLEQGMAIHSTILALRMNGQRSLVGYSPWVCKESDMTE